jgi:hypothetical protein
VAEDHAEDAAEHAGGAGLRRGAWRAVGA